MENYVNNLAPWETKEGAYQGIQLGKDIDDQKEVLKDQIIEMIRSRVASSSAIIASRGLPLDSISDIAYTDKDIGQGMQGLKAAFEWGISDVVWQLELNRNSLENMLEDMYAGMKELLANRKEAVAAYEKGDIDNALAHFLKLLKKNKYDFTVHMSLGMIYLMNKIDKEEALTHFDNAIQYARKHSSYYGSYALLHKALIKRDLGSIDEAEQFSEEAAGLSPDLTEATYQRAVYNALLDKPDKAVSLLKKAINDDIIYCLKINNENAFDEMRPQITEMFEKIRTEENENIRGKLIEQEENVTLLNNAVSKFKQMGYDIPKTIKADSLQGQSKELRKMIEKNSIFDARMANVPLAEIGKMLELKVTALQDKYRALESKLDNQIKEQGEVLLKEKKQGGGGIKSFLVYLAGGQLIAIPIGLSMSSLISLYISEGIIFAICFYLTFLSHGSGWDTVLKLQEKKDELDRAMRKIK